MESTEASLRINYVIYTKVADVRERFTERYTNMAEAKTENQVEKEQKSLGWFVLFEGSHEALFFGIEQPTFAKGDRIRMTFEKVEPCPHSKNTNPQSS